MVEERATPLWREHLGLLLTASVFAAFVIRLAAVSRFDDTTMLAILERTAPSTALLGFMLTAGAYLAIGLVNGWRINVAVQAARERRRFPWSEAAYLAAAAVATALFASWALAVFTLVASFLQGVSLARLPPPSPAGVRVERRVTVTATLALAVFFVLTDDNMWLPPERVRLRDGSVVVAYVLERGATDYVLLEDHDRTVRRLPVGDVADTEYCTPAADAWHARSVLDLVLTTPRYPVCRD